MGENPDDVTITALTADHRATSLTCRQHSINAIVLAYWISAIVDNMTRRGAKLPNYLEDTQVRAQTFRFSASYAINGQNYRAAHTSSRRRDNERPPEA